MHMGVEMTATHLHLKEVTSTFTVTGGEDGGVHMQEATLLEEFLDSHGGCVANPQ